jgi:hypothetical protein
MGTTFLANNVKDVSAISTTYVSTTYDGNRLPASELCSIVFYKLMTGESRNS